MFDRFVESNPDISAEERVAVRTLALELSPPLEELFEKCAINGAAYDLRDFIKEKVSRLVGRPLIRALSPFFVGEMRRLVFFAPPPEIFSIDNWMVRLNPDNAAILVKAGRELGLLPVTD
jgi:hypothetical protein